MKIKCMCDKNTKLYTLISLIIITSLNTINMIILNLQKYALSSIYYAKTCKIKIVPFLTE